MPHSYFSAEFVLYGKPATKKNSVGMYGGGKGRRKNVVQSPQYVAWALTAVRQLGVEWAGRQTIASPVNVRAVFYRDRRPDLINLCQALGDILQKAKVLKNDKLIAGWDGSRLVTDGSKDRVEVWITEMEAV